MFRFLKTTVIGGLVFLVPIIIFAIIITKAIELTNKLAVPLSAMIPVDSIGNVTVVNLITIIIILLICFIAGIAAKTTIASFSIGLLESKVLSKFPAYDFLKSKMHAVLQTEEIEGMQPVLVRLDDYWQIALEVEPISGGTVAIYLLGAPDPWSGSLCFVTKDRVQPLELTLAKVLRTLKGLGRGSNEQLREYLQNEQQRPGE